MSENAEKKENRKLCPFGWTHCAKEVCEWWLEFANSCAIPLTACILADSTICQKEDSMSENKKPRLAEILNVEVGEKFKIKGYFDGEFPFYEIVVFQLLEDGTYTTTPAMFQGSAAALLRSIDHPERIIHMPRWTKQEVKDAKAIRRILPEARDIDRVTETMTVVRDEDGFCLLTLQKDMFPNVKEGQTVKLTDIIGGNE